MEYERECREEYIDGQEDWEDNEEPEDEEIKMYDYQVNTVSGDTAHRLSGYSKETLQLIKLCKSCKYRSESVCNLTMHCEYSLITGHRRPCPGTLENNGECECYEKGKKLPTLKSDFESPMNSNHDHCYRYRIGDYVLIQSKSNNHYSIYHYNGRRAIGHAACSKPLTESEAKEKVEAFIKIYNEMKE